MCLFFHQRNGILIGTVYKEDYHDREYEALEQKQVGLGEIGAAAVLPTKISQTEKDDLYKVNGFNARLSDEIALNRSLKDIRHHK